MCEYVKERCDGKLLYYLTGLPSDAVPIMNVKGLVGRIKKGLYYNPKSHEIYVKLIAPIDDVFQYSVLNDKEVVLPYGQWMKTSDLKQSCEKLYNK